ncbi:MAG: YbjN domain-containing protein [Alphaproteobacteria bacterium]
MREHLAEETGAPTNPLDLIEEIVSANDWAFDRTSDHELVAGIRGRWTEYDLFFGWREEMSLLQFCCACEMAVSAPRRAPVHELLSIANDKLWLGHFAVVPEDNLLTFRHAILLRGARGASVEQLEDLVDLAIAESDRFYPAFQFCIWGGKSPRDAITAAMLQPVGEA